MARRIRKIGQLILGAALLWGLGCQKEPPTRASASPALTRVQLQLDWFPEPAHGGFYQAAEKGYYGAVGLAVEILPGGPGGRPTQKVASGQVPFSMGRSDDMMLAAAEGLPVLVVAALMQHDPQALLLHADNPVETFADLDGRAVMAYPGSAWIPYLQKRYGIAFDLQPMSFGLARFIADPDLIQACFVTDEPFRLRESGVAVKTLLLADSGYDPYRVMVAHRPFADANPAIVRAFVAASIRGWEDYMEGDPTPAHTRIAQENDHMTPAQMEFSHTEMKRRQFVSGRSPSGPHYGHLDPARLEEHADLLHELGVLDERLPISAYADLSYLPATTTP
jgi:NitT/TauT family transport system substrate-binding protein